MGVRGQVIGVPPEFADDLQAVHFATGVPRSWIAAVCEMTAWDPFYEKKNVEGAILTIRQFGIAGVWARIPETQVGGFAAGWFSNTWMKCCALLGDCFQYPSGGPFTPWLSVRSNMTLAAAILKNSADAIQAICGEVNNLAFLRWQWGCLWTPIDPITGDPDCAHFPPGTPNIFIAEIEKLMDAQKLYAEIFQEPVIGAPPISVSISAQALVVPPNTPLTFTANVSGGNPPYQLYSWDFGDGITLDTQNPQAAHSYANVGTFSARVRVTDNVGGTALSPVLNIEVKEGAPPPPGKGLPWWLLLGAVGVVGLFALAGKKSKRQQAQEKRRKAQELRSRASQERLKGNNAGAANMEAEATRLEQEATQLEAEAAREEALKYQLQKPR